MAKSDDVGALVKAALLLGTAWMSTLALPGALLFALANMALNAQWLSMLWTGFAVAAAAMGATAMIASAGFSRIKPLLWPAATAVVVAVLACSYAQTPGG